MTNKEWIFTLEDKILVDFLVNKINGRCSADCAVYNTTKQLFRCRDFRDCEKCVQEWLREEHKE